MARSQGSQLYFPKQGISMTDEKTVSRLKDVIVDALEDIKAIDIRSLDVREMTSVVDFMVIATGTSTRQVKALADNVSLEAKKAGFAPLSSEGQESADWILIDFGDISVHVMLPEARELYDLERLWHYSPNKRPEQKDTDDLTPES